MKIQNIDCRYLKLHSSAYESAYNSNQLKSVEVIAVVNNEIEITEIISVDELANEWNLYFNFQSGATIEQLHLKNIFTNQLFPLLSDSNSYPITAQGIIDLQTAINEVMHTVLNLSSANAVFTITNSRLSCKITGLPHYIIAHNIYYSYINISKDVYFTYLDSNSYIVSNAYIYIIPDFFDKTSFIDGVYHFKTRVLTKANLLIEEETCFFVDCVMSQNILETINPDICNETDVSLLMLHYSLGVTSNEECDCEKMQDVFDFLEKHIDTYNNNPCGC